MKKIRAFASATVVGIALIAGQAFARRPSVYYFKAPVKFKGTGCPGANSATVSDGDCSFSVPVPVNVPRFSGFPSDCGLEGIFKRPD